MVSFCQMADKPVTLEFQVKITLPAEAAADSDMRRLVQMFLLEFAAEIVRCASTLPPGPPRGRGGGGGASGKISTG